MPDSTAPDEEAATAVVVDAAQMAAAKDATAAMHAAQRLLRDDPAKAGVDPEHAEGLADWVYGAADDLAGSRRHAMEYGGDPFEYADEPGSVQRAAAFARSVLARTANRPHGRTP